MNVFLTFDIEVWCNGWEDLDKNFPHSFERYVYGASSHGNYALPKTLEILNRYGLKGVFFVEPLFAARFGAPSLSIIVDLIQKAGHEIQLHLHTEWTDEAIEPLIENCATKRQHLSYYTLEEQVALIGHGRRLLEAASGTTINAFRAGSFAVNEDSFEALGRNGIWLDSSLNRCYAVSAPAVVAQHLSDAAFLMHGVTTIPVTVLTDGFGRPRPLQIAACSFAEMREALVTAHLLGNSHFVLVSHNFEMLKPGTSQPDWIVVKRFENLCAFLAGDPSRYHVRGFGTDLRLPAGQSCQSKTASVSWRSTGVRYVEQLQRRLVS